jgi:hypothetical protein
MAAILTQMRGNPIHAMIFRQQGGANGTRKPLPSSITQRRNMVNIQA